MDRVRSRVLAEHRKTITAVVDAGETVANALEQWPVTDGDAIRLPLDRLLGERGLETPLLALLETGADALGAEIQGQPVAAPPYLVVTSRGPLCRGTLTDGRRLVIELALVTVETRPRRYRFCEPTPEECLRISLTE